MNEPTADTLAVLERIEAGADESPASLDNDALVHAVNRLPDTDPRYAGLETELLARACGGDLGCQRGVRDLLSASFIAGELSLDLFLERTEPYVRMAADHGWQCDRIVLAGFLFTKVSFLPDDDEASFDAGCEALLILARMIRDEGRDDLLGGYLMCRSEASQEARDYLDTMLLLDGLEIDPQPEPEALAKTWRMQPPHETLQ